MPIKTFGELFARVGVPGSVNMQRYRIRYQFLCLGAMMLLSALGCREKPQVDYDLRVEQQSLDGTEVETPTIVTIRETIDLRVPAALPKEIPVEANVQPGMPLKLELEFEGGAGFEDWPRFMMSGLYRDDTRKKRRAEQVASDVCTVDSNDDQGGARRGGMTFHVPRESGRYFLIVTSIDEKTVYLVGWVHVSEDH